MNDITPNQNDRINISVEKLDYAITSSGHLSIPVVIRNLGLGDDRFVLSVVGLPQAWVSSSLPVVALAAGEEREVSLTLQTPVLKEQEAGKYPLTLRATSQRYPDQFSEVKINLTVTAQQVPTRIEIQLDSQQFSVAPGSSTTFNLVLRNNGLSVDSVRLFIEGISTSWVSTPSPITQLESGESKEIPVTISVPRSHQSRAGRHPLTVRAVSQLAPDQAVELECVLTIGAYVQFKSELQPTALQAGQNAQVIIVNQGNITESFTINWGSQEDQLSFQLWQRLGEKDVFTESQEHVQRLEPGQQASVYFKAGLRRQPLLGKTAAYPYLVQVRSSEGEVQTSHGEVEDRALIPLWVLPVVVALCLSVVCIAIFFLNWQVGGNAAATETASTATQVALQATQTFVAQETHNAQLTAGAPTNTPEPTITPEPTVTPTLTEVPTDTPEPTATEVPTATPTDTPGPTATEIQTEVPTEAPPPTEVPPEPVPTEKPGSDLLNMTWKLDAYLADFEADALTDPLPEVTVDLNFAEDGNFTGNAGCNTYSGRSVTDGVQILFSNFSVSMQICEQPQGIMEQEAIYLRLLERVEEYRINADEQLELITYVLNAENQREEVILLVYEGEPIATP